MFDFDPYQNLSSLSPVKSFELASEDVRDGAPIPRWLYGPDIGGTGESPQLSWSGFPAETKSFALTCYDPDAPTAAGFWHWAVVDLPADVTSLPRGAGTGALPDGAHTLDNDLRVREFAPAGPPPGTGVHRYFFVVHAVDVPTLGLPDGATPTVLGFNLYFHTLARAVLVPVGEFPGA